MHRREFRARPFPRTMVIIAGTLAIGAHPASAQVRRFVFAPDRATPDAVTVAPDRVYRDGYGYEPGNPALFSIAVPPGNYRVTVTLGGQRAATDTTIKAESRRLMLDRVATAPGRRIERSFIVNVRNGHLAPPPPTAPGGKEVLLGGNEQHALDWDDKLTLEMLGEHPGLAALAIEPVTVPTVFLLGDSTVTDQSFEPAASWGQMLTAFFRPDVAVANHARSGAALKSFLTDLRLAKVLEDARPGDWALIQFGHNDQKAQWPQTHAPAATTYRSYLGTFIDEFRRLGVRPILVTPPERRNWAGGDRIRPTLGDYAAAVRAVGVEKQVPVIDLNAASIRFYEALGPERAPLAFNDGGKDATHHDNYGAWVLARAVAQAIADARLPLAAHLKEGLPPFDPSQPPDPATFRLAPSTMRNSARPEGS